MKDALGNWRDAPGCGCNNTKICWDLNSDLTKENDIEKGTMYDQGVLVSTRAGQHLSQSTTKRISVWGLQVTSAYQVGMTQGSQKSSPTLT